MDEEDSLEQVESGNYKEIVLAVWKTISAWALMSEVIVFVSGERDLTASLSK